jgi:Cu-Zn family superoxide dismutase
MMPITRFAFLPLAVSLTMVLACTSRRPQLTREPTSALAELQGIGDSPIHGVLRFSQLGESAVRIEGTFQGLEPGHTYALHIHSERTCQPAREPGRDFDPFESRQHGSPDTDPGTRHAGDLPSITADSSGSATVHINTAKGLSLWPDIYCIRERAVVLHAGPDDYRTPGHGGAGDRAACGLVVTTVTDK